MRAARTYHLGFLGWWRSKWRVHDVLKSIATLARLDNQTIPKNFNHVLYSLSSICQDTTKTAHSSRRRSSIFAPCSDLFDFAASPC